MQLFGGDNRLIGMGRKARIHFPGAVYHVLNRGVDGRSIYADDEDRVYFLRSMDRLMREACARVLSYCLMGNHFHLAVQVGNTPLSSIIHRLSTGYSRAFNLRQKREGHLFQARHKAIICCNDAYLATLIRYIHQNPVRAGLVKKVRDWPWSSAHLQPDAGEDDEIKDFDPWQDATTEQILDLRRSLEVPGAALSEIGSRITAESCVSIEELRSESTRRELTVVRSRLTKEAIMQGHSLREVAAFLRASPSAITRYSQYR